jgi:hypothetical protein
MADGEAPQQRGGFLSRLIPAALWPLLLAVLPHRHASPPRRSARVAGAAAASSAPLAPLPPNLVFALIPVDTRLHCREVCRGWRAALSDASYWKELDLSDTSGVAARITPALLFAASRLAGASFAMLAPSLRLTRAALLHRRRPGVA